MRNNGTIEVSAIQPHLIFAAGANEEQDAHPDVVSMIQVTANVASSSQPCGTVNPAMAIKNTPMALQRIERVLLDLRIGPHLTTPLPELHAMQQVDASEDTRRRWRSQTEIAHWPSLLR